MLGTFVILANLSLNSGLGIALVLPVVRTLRSLPKVLADRESPSKALVVGRLSGPPLLRTLNVSRPPTAKVRSPLCPQYKQKQATFYEVTCFV